jgi:hypothetical protein
MVGCTSYMCDIEMNMDEGILSGKKTHDGLYWVSIAKVQTGYDNKEMRHGYID